MESNISPPITLISLLLLKMELYKILLLQFGFGFLSLCSGTVRSSSLKDEQNFVQYQGDMKFTF